MARDIPLSTALVYLPTACQQRLRQTAQRSLRRPDRRCSLRGQFVGSSWASKSRRDCRNYGTALRHASSSAAPLRGQRQSSQSQTHTTFQLERPVGTPADRLPPPLTSQTLPEREEDAIAVDRYKFDDRVLRIAEDQPAEGISTSEEPLEIPAHLPSWKEQVSASGRVNGSSSSCRICNCMAYSLG